MSFLANITSTLATQFEVSQPPSDVISSVVFAPDNTNRLLVASWDRNVYLYEIAEGTEDATLVNKFEHRAPVLDICFGANGNEAYTAGLDCSVKRFVAPITHPTMDDQRHTKRPLWMLIPIEQNRLIFRRADRSEHT